MLDFFIRHRLGAFERRWSYSADSLRTLLGLSRKAFLRFDRATALARQREDLPLAAWAVAKLVAARQEDCGPCTQLVVDMARAGGVPAEVLRAAFADDETSLRRLDPVAATAWAFAAAWATNRCEAELAPRREAALQVLGGEGLASLVLVMLGVQLYPKLKRALGHAQACQAVSIDGQLWSHARHAAPT